jgi:hypothetical protein
MQQMRKGVFCAVRAEILEARRVIARRDSLLEIVQKSRSSCCGGRTETVRGRSAKKRPLLWPLPSSAVKSVSETSSLCVIMICKI